jgi:hypothetical protein
LVRITGKILPDVANKFLVVLTALASHTVWLNGNPVGKSDTNRSEQR